MEFKDSKLIQLHSLCVWIIVLFLLDYTCQAKGSEHVRHKHNTPAPDFLPSPSNVTFHKGELAVLRCSVYNLGTKTVVWRRLESSFPLTSGTMTVVADNRLQIGHVEYKNQWDLMIKNVQPDDEGVYECQVASRDKTIRKLVQLTVLADPETVTPEIRITEELYVERGESITLQCNATGEYYPPDEMDWFRNGQRLSSDMQSGVSISKQYSISKRTFTSNLYIERATMDDGGTYVCRTSSMQIASTKVHVLNAETFNRKRGTLDGETSGKMSALPSSVGTSAYQKFSKTAVILVIVISLCFKHFNIPNGSKA